MRPVVLFTFARRFQMSVKAIAQSVLTTVIALVVIHYVAPASIKSHLGVQ
jgi:hypothetical protein